MIITCGSLYAQSTVTGRVVDSNNEGIPGVTIVVKDTGSGAVTDFEGNFSIDVASEDAVLVFSSVGFATQEVTVGDQTSIEITLEDEISELTEVVVIGYGTQKKKLVTGAIESVSSEELNSQPVARIDQALQGRAAGVQVVNQSGQPGEAPAIRIRGVGTDGDASPLILVDGMTVNSIDNINPGDVESMEVLKDAASTAIYGARAANGVILITTKSGSADKFSISYNGYKGVQNVAKTVDLLNAEQYVEVMAGARARNLNGDLFDASQTIEHDTDWQEALFTKNAPIEYHEIGMQGGNEKATFASSLSYFNQHGIIGGDKSKIEKYIGRVKVAADVHPMLRIGSDVTYTNLVTRGVASNSSFNGEYNSALNMDPLTPVFETSLQKLGAAPYSNQPVLVNGDGLFFGISENVGQEVVNPLAKLQTQNQIFTKDQILANIFGELKPIEHLTLRSSLGMDLSYLEWEGFNDIYYLSSTNETIATGVYKSMVKNTALQSENTIRYDRTFGDHKFDLMVGNTFLNRTSESLSGSGQGVDVVDPNLRFLDLVVDSTALVGGGASNYYLISYFSRLLYDYKDRVSLSASYRRDGSSNFGSNNRFGGFWAFGASWVINEEPFFPDLPFVSYTKLRASWGQNGNDRIGAFSYASIVDFNIAYNTASGPVTGGIPAFLENQDIKWESGEQFDVGVDAGFLDNRLTLTMDYYVRITRDLLQYEDAPDVIGIEATFNNVGEMKNKGVEITLGWRNRQGELGYSVNVNAAYNKNKMTKIADESGFITGAYWALAGEVTRTIERYPVTSFIGFKTDGIFQTVDEVNAYTNSDDELIQPNAEPGDFRFVDINGDGLISDADKTVIGSPLPDWTFGSTINLDYKNFDFMALFTGQLGSEIFNGIGRPDIPTSNRQAYVINRWTPENPSNTIPRLVTNNLNKNYTRPTDQLNIEDGSYLRLKNIQIGYSLPNKIKDKIGCTNWRFYISAENLLTLTKYSGPDPEVGGTSIRDTGIDRGIYPQARIMRIGTTVTF